MGFVTMLELLQVVVTGGTGGGVQAGECRL